MKFFRFFCKIIAAEQKSLFDAGASVFFVPKSVIGYISSGCVFIGRA